MDQDTVFEGIFKLCEHWKLKGRVFGASEHDSEVKRIARKISWFQKQKFLKKNSKFCLFHILYVLCAFLLKVWLLEKIIEQNSKLFFHTIPMKFPRLKQKYSECCMTQSKVTPTINLNIYLRERKAYFILFSRPVSGDVRIFSKVIYNSNKNI